MLTNKEYKRYIKFEKTIEDLYDDSNNGLFQTFNDQSITHKPEFVRTSLFNLSRLDDMILGRYGERFLNKMGSQEYSVNSYDELIYPNDLKNLAEEITSVYYRKWDNLLYLYSIQMGRDYNPIENYSSYEKTTYNDVTDEKSHTGTDTDTTTYNSVKDERKHTGDDTDTTTYNNVTDENSHTGADTDTTTYNSVTDTRNYTGDNTDTTTYNNVTDELTKDGTEKESQNAEVKQRPLKTATKVSDEYGENGLNGIKDTKTYNRNYTTTDTMGTSGTPYTSTEERQIAGMNSAGYSNSELITKTEIGVKGSQAFSDGNNSGETTERTGKHSSINEFGGDIQQGTIVAGDLQITETLDEQNNFHELSFTNRTDTNVKSGSEETEHAFNSTDTNVRTGSEELEHAFDSTETNVRSGSEETEHAFNSTDTNTRTGSEELERAFDSTETNVRSGNFEVEKTGNIGVMTASQMLESAWNGEIERNFLNVVLRDVADFISLQCY